jgi:hypothetical protein
MFYLIKSRVIIKKISDFTLKIRFFLAFSIFDPLPPYIFCKLRPNFKILPPPPKIFFSLFDLHEKIHSTIKVLLKLKKDTIEVIILKGF